MMKKILCLILACLLCSFALISCGAVAMIFRGEKDENLAKVNLVSEKTDYVAIQVEDYGTIVVHLRADVAPITVANFQKLVSEKFYDGLIFHRVIEGFMIQGGDPKGNGTGGSKENIKGEFSANGVDNTLSHKRGVISMARQGENPYTGEMNYDSASSQFFICHADSPHLDGDYAAFGYVTEGMDVVDAVCTTVKPSGGNGKIAAEDQPVMTSVTIRTE